MVKIKLLKSKGYILIELLIAAAIFVSAMTSIITLIFICINASNTAMAANKNNYSIRQINESLQNTIQDSGCVQVDGTGLKVVFKSDNCASEIQSYEIINGRLVANNSGKDERYITPSGIFVSDFANDEKVFTVSNNLLTLNIKLTSQSSSNKPITIEYKNAYAY